MSTSTNAVMAYGVDLGGNGELDGDTETFNRFIEIFELEQDPEGDPLEDSPDEIANAAEEPLAKLGLTLESHCSDGARSYVLAVAKTVQLAYRGYPVKVKPLARAFRAEVNLLKVLKQLKVTKKPALLLFSWWG